MAVSVDKVIYQYPGGTDPTKEAYRYVEAVPQREQALQHQRTEGTPNSLQSPKSGCGRGRVGLPEVEAPCHNVRAVTVILAIAFLIVDGEEGVSLVRTTDVDFHGS